MNNIIFTFLDFYFLLANMYIFLLGLLLRKNHQVFMFKPNIIYNC